MIYQSGYNKRKRRVDHNYVRIALIGFIAFVIITLILFAFMKPFQRLLQSIFSSNALMSQYLSSASYYVQDRDTLNAEIENLKSKNLDLQLELLRKEGLLLSEKSFIEAISTTSQSVAIGKVIRRPPFSLFDTIIIDQGRSHGVEKGDRAMYRNVVVGEVSEVFEHSSKIELVTTPGHNFQVIIGASSTPAVARGMGGGFFTLELPMDTVVEIGDLIRGVDRFGSLFGIVEHTEPLPSKTLQIIYGRPPFEIQSIEWVKIEKATILNL